MSEVAFAGIEVTHRKLAFACARTLALPQCLLLSIPFAIAVNVAIRDLSFSHTARLEGLCDSYTYICDPWSGVDGAV